VIKNCCHTSGAAEEKGFEWKKGLVGMSSKVQRFRVIRSSKWVTALSKCTREREIGNETPAANNLLLQLATWLQRRDIVFRR
jgi:hypothetical protein